jgi:hypothetical protein
VGVGEDRKIVIRPKGGGGQGGGRPMGGRPSGRGGRRYER